MGMSNANVALILAALAQGARIEKAATLGMQGFWPSKNELQRILSVFGYQLSADEISNKVGASGSKFLEFLGADEVTEFDASDYEGAKVVHDMNKPLPAEWHGKFDFIYDGGTMEHIYNVSQVVENLDSMLKIGGHLVISTTGNNLFGHGFYQFSPEFFYRVFSKENGWNTKMVLLAEHQLCPPRFWHVIDPKLIRDRIEIQTKNQIYTMIITEKIASGFLFQTPQQSDYAAIWSHEKEVDKNCALPVAKKNIFKKVFARLKSEAAKIQKLILHITNYFSSRFRPTCGLHNKRGIQKMTLSELANYRSKSTLKDNAPCH